MKFIIATNNEKKLVELERILNPLGIEAVSAKEAGVVLDDVDETGKTFFENDANAAAIGEYITGDYDVPVFVMVTLGTGIGGGIIINGKLLRGCNYAAAEFGHMSINIDGCDCNCGRKGCFEDYASATALIQQAKEAMEQDDGKESLLWKEIAAKDANRNVIPPTIITMMPAKLVMPNKGAIFMIRNAPAATGPKECTMAKAGAGDEPASRNQPPKGI